MFNREVELDNFHVSLSSNQFKKTTIMSISKNLPPSYIDSLTKKAVQDLVTRLSIPQEHIQVIEAKAVVWPNSSLGCPQPGMRYADMLVPGYLIRLKAQQTEFEYHAGKIFFIR